MAWTTNLIPNPSLELDLTGYSAVGQAELLWDPSDSLFGDFSARVDCDASQAGQGVQVADVVTPAGSYSASLHLVGTGTVEIAVVTNPGGIIRAAKTVTIGPEWARYLVENVTVPSGSTTYLLVRTKTASFATFWVDGVQLEPGATATQYCDGDQYGCEWTGAPHVSASTRELEFPLEADGAAVADGSIAVYLPGPVSLELHGALSVDGTAEPVVGVPWGAFDDFAVHPLTVPDPAMTMFLAGNPGAFTGDQGEPWARNWGMWLPPKDYPVSSGYAWKRAAYAAVGFEYKQIPVNQLQYLDSVQFEAVSEPSLATTGPTDYVQPRQITVTIKPDRLNWSTNPSFEVDTSGWEAAGDCTLERDPGEAADLGGPNTAAGKVTVAADTDGTHLAHPLPKLLPGRDYTVSAYLKWDAAIANIGVRLLHAQGNISALQFGGGQLIPYGGGAFGDIPYGGDTGVPAGGDWVRVWFTFTTADDAEGEEIRFVPTLADPSEQGTFWVDGVLVEDGDRLRPYFDGDYGTDYLWRADGDTGLSESFFYRDRVRKVSQVQDLVAQNTPMGISATEPEFAVLPLQ